MNAVIKLLPDKIRVRIHWFIRGEGPVVRHSGATMTAIGPFVWPAAKGRVACQPNLADISPKIVNGEIHPMPLTDDPRAATCPECMAVPEWKAMMEYLGEILDTGREMYSGPQPVNPAELLAGSK